MWIILLLVIIVLFIYLTKKQEHFSNLSDYPGYDYANTFDKLVILDNLNNLNDFNSTPKTVDYNLGKLPMYNMKDYEATVWHLRFKNLIKNRYAYDDDKTTSLCKINDGNNFVKDNNNKVNCDLMNAFMGNEGTNCHGNNCDENNCYGDNCYEHGYAKLKDLPIYLHV